MERGNSTCEACEAKDLCAEREQEFTVTAMVRPGSLHCRSLKPDNIFTKSGPSSVQINKDATIEIESLRLQPGIGLKVDGVESISLDDGSEIHFHKERTVILSPKGGCVQKVSLGG